MWMFSLLMALSFVWMYAGCFLLNLFFIFIFNSLLSHWRVAKLFTHAICWMLKTLLPVFLFSLWFSCVSQLANENLYEELYTFLWHCSSECVEVLNGSIISILLLITNEIQQAHKTRFKIKKVSMHPSRAVQQWSKNVIKLAHCLVALCRFFQ